MNTWEYTTRLEPSDEEMNALGAEGWELVAVHPIDPPRGGCLHRYVFKHPARG